jgi:hypothetical protein
MAPPRFWYPSERAKSTRIRRISCADTAKECARSRHPYLSAVHQSQIDFVDQRRGLQGMVRTFSRHVAFATRCNCSYIKAVSFSKACSSPAVQALRSCVTSATLASTIRARHVHYNKTRLTFTKVILPSGI